MKKEREKFLGLIWWSLCNRFSLPEALADRLMDYHKMRERALNDMAWEVLSHCSAEHWAEKIVSDIDEDLLAESSIRKNFWVL